MKAVVDHADGTRETFVTDGTWKVHKADQFTNATITRRNGDSGDNAERYDARAEIPAGTRRASTTPPGRPPTRSARTRAR